MGKRQLLTLLFVLGITLPIQLQAQVKDKGFFVEGSFAYADEEQFSGGKHYENYFIIKPAVGYQFNSKWNVGFKLEFQCGRKEGRRYRGIIPFVRYNFCNLGKFHLFSEAKTSIYGKWKTMLGEDKSYLEAGLSLGASLPLNRHLKVICQYLHIGYSEQYQKSGAFIHSGDWGIDANIKRLQLGLNWTF